MSRSTSANRLANSARPGGVSGSDHDAIASAEAWDPATASFSSTGSLAEARGRHTATLLPDGRDLIVGGFGVDGFLASAEIWDPATGTFSVVGTLVEAHDDHTATLLTDGRVLVIGGWDGDSAFVLAEIWGQARP